MHGLGNDFVVLDAASRALKLNPEQVRRLADRRRGIGCDQVLLVEPAQGEEDFRYRIYNADGSESGQCGNGARCLGRFIERRRLSSKQTLRIATGQSEMTLWLLDEGLVRVDMGRPRLNPDEVPLRAASRQQSYRIQLAGGDEVEFAALSMGNPHAVLRVEHVDEAPVTSLGAQIAAHPGFVEGVNVGFMEVVDRSHLRLRVFERGAGETEACGSGACAAVVAGRLRGWLDEAVEVSLPGGALRIDWGGGNEPVLMTGPAEWVYEGWIEL